MCDIGANYGKTFICAVNFLDLIFPNYNGQIRYQISSLIYSCLTLTAHLCVSPGSSAFVLPENLLEMQTLGVHPRPLHQQLYFSNNPRRLRNTIKMSSTCNICH